MKLNIDIPEWTVYYDAGGYATIINEERQERIANLCQSGHGETRKDKFNARLIAAAPQLYEFVMKLKHEIYVNHQIEGENMLELFSVLADGILKMNDIDDPCL